MYLRAHADQSSMAVSCGGHLKGDVPATRHRRISHLQQHSCDYKACCLLQQYLLFTYAEPSCIVGRYLLLLRTADVSAALKDIAHGEMNS